MSAPDELAHLDAAVGSRRVLSESTFAGLDADIALDQRDCDPFDSAWTSAFQSIDGHVAEIEPSTQPMIDALRQSVYMRVFEVTENSDIAGCASDDFEIIAKGVVLDLADPWLNALWLSYADHRFPTGDLRPVTGRLRDLVGFTR